MQITLEITSPKRRKTKRILVDGPAVLSHDWNKAAQQLASLVPKNWTLLFYRQEWGS